MSNRTRNLVADLNAKLAARQVHSLGEEFYKWFGLTEGDLLEIQRKDGSWQPCTILQNREGGHGAQADGGGRAAGPDTRGEARGAQPGGGVLGVNLGAR
jgi:hypothetical protein